MYFNSLLSLSSSSFKLFVLDMHKVNFYHRGVKPENILLDKEWQFNLLSALIYSIITLFLFVLHSWYSLSPKLADPFSIRSYTPNPQQFPSSSLYQSPESLLNRLSTPEMDVWSLGCVIYELCTLKPPFTDTDSINTSQPILITNFTGLSILHLVIVYTTIFIRV